MAPSGELHRGEVTHRDALSCHAVGLMNREDGQLSVWPSSLGLPELRLRSGEAVRSDTVDTGDAATQAGASSVPGYPDSHS